MWALMLMLIMAIYLAQIAESWQFRIRRAKEEQLLQVGVEIRNAITAYVSTNQGNNPQTAYPNTLDDLVQDPRVPFPRRFLRKAYKDPITGEDWLYVAAPGGGFLGVSSKSTDKPLKATNFSDDLQTFNDAKSYQDWRFAAWPNNGGGGGRR